MSELSRRDFIKAASVGVLGGLSALGVGKVVVSGMEAYRLSESARRIREELKSNSDLNPDRKLELMRELHKEQKSLGWENLIKDGLPKEAFKSACRIEVFDLSLGEGSASVLSLRRNSKNYRLIPTAGHVLEIITDNCLGVALNRHEEMGTKTRNKLERYQFGIAYTVKKGDFTNEEDFGFLIVEEGDAINSGISDVFPWDDVASADDFTFDPLPKNASGFYGVGFPGLLGVAPLACMDGSVKIFEQAERGNNITVDDCFAYGGNSGTLVYWKKNREKAKVVGTMYAHFDVTGASNDDPNRMYWDNANIFPFSTLGEKRYGQMLDTAITDLESRKR